MIRIGDFARIGGVSIATLRFYDEEGLLSPRFVNEETGYRYYERDQLALVLRIRALKELGLSLDEIRTHMSADVEDDAVRRLLTDKRRDAVERIEAARAQIVRIDRYLNDIEKEIRMSNVEVTTKTVPPLKVASVYLEIPRNSQVANLLEDAYGEIFEALKKTSIAPAGPCMAVWYSAPEDLSNETVDAAVPINAEALANGRVSIKTFPSVDVVAATHKGPFNEFRQCHVALSEWLAANGKRLDGAYREIYISHSPEESITEVQYPIAPI